MEHIMKLNPHPMEMMKDGKKTIEMRLYDEKRQMIAVGDTIKFVNREDVSDVLWVMVEKIFLFDSFDELYSTLPLLECGYTIEDIDRASASDMDFYYSKEKQRQYGVMGIKINKIIV